MPADGLDPNIPLAAHAPAGANPLGMVGQFAQIQNQLNTARLFRQTFAARQMAGQILAGADPNDPEAGIRALMSNPQTAPFAGEIINNIRGAQATLLSMQGEQQKQAQSGLEGFMKMLPGVMADPSQFNALAQANMATLSPTAQARVAPAIDSLRQALTGGLPTEPGAARAVFNNRLNGLLVAGGVSPDSIRAITGTPTTINLGGRVVAGVQAPAIAGGAFIPASSLATSLTPQVAQPGGVVVGGGGAGAYSAPGPANALAPSAAPRTPVTAMPLAAPSATGGSALAGDGRPLFVGANMASPRVGVGIGGVNILSPAQQNTAKELSDEFNNQGVKEFQGAQNSMASFRYMDNALDTLAKGGGFLVPGTAEQARVELGKFVNTVTQMTGTAPAFDPTKIASAEDFMKETKRSGFQLINTMFGGQREAAETIQNATASVPGIENSYLGGKILVDSLRAAAQRAIDQRNFQNAWQQQPGNQGNLTGSAEEFNRLHPAEDYANGVLAKYGMTEKGFTSPEAVRQAVQQGYMTRDQGLAALRAQWPGGPPAANGQ